MNTNLFHVFRNTAMGRETYLHSLYFCKILNIGLTVYLPASTHFTMMLDNETVRVDLDGSYLTGPDSAADRAQRLAESYGVDITIFSPKSANGSQSADLPRDFAFMTCPRSISDLSSRIGLGFIGAKVRRIIRSADFPVLIASPGFKPWKSITVLFGGSKNAINALRLGIHIANRTGFPLKMLTCLEEDRAFYQNTIDMAELKQGVKQSVALWDQFENGRFEEHLYTVPHDSLVLVGAYGHGIIKDFLFGSKLEKIQATLTNNLLIAGPRVGIPHCLQQDPTPKTETDVIGAIPPGPPGHSGNRIGDHCSSAAPNSLY